MDQMVQFKDTEWQTGFKTNKQANSHPQTRGYSALVTKDPQ